MRHYTRAAAFLLAVLLVAVSSVPVCAQSFTDVDASYWGYSFVEKAASWGIVTGYTDGSFRSSKNVSCQEAMTMICKTLAVAGIEPLDGTYTENWTVLLDQLAFTDWAKPFAAQLFEDGFAAESDFVGAAAAVPAQRQLVGAWFARAIGLPEAPLCSCDTFTDDAQIRSAFIGETDALSRFGVINGYTDGTFRPRGQITRGEFATVCVKSVQLLQELNASQVKRKLADTLFLAYGSLDVTDASARQIRITENGAAGSYRIPEDAVILLDGKPVSFDALSSLAGRELAVSCLYGFDSPLILQTKSLIEHGTVEMFFSAGDFYLLTVDTGIGQRIQYAIEKKGVPVSLKTGDEIDFISEGAHILELVNTSHTEQ